MLPWRLEHHVFACDTYVKNGESVTEIQRLFKQRFNIGRHGNVPSRNSILRWVNVLRTTGSLLKTKPPSPARTARTPRNVDRVRAAIIRSPRRSARRHSAELVMSEHCAANLTQRPSLSTTQNYDCPTIESAGLPTTFVVLTNNARHV